MANKEISESGLTFNFQNVHDAVKFDDNLFYREYFNMLPGSKGVDIIAESSDWIQLIEVKNCSGHEEENMWRTHINNTKIASAPHNLNVEHRESLDIEVAKKVAMTLTCVYGAWNKQEFTDKTKELEFVWKGLSSQKLLTHKKKMYVILILEGKFQASAVRGKKMIMKSLQESIEKKLKWLDCRVSVVDSETYNHNLFKMTKQHLT